MPHAAGGQLQQSYEIWITSKDGMFQCRTRQVVSCNYIESDTFITCLKFQCRTRQVVSCNYQRKFRKDKRICVSMPHAASGRLQLQVDYLNGQKVPSFNAARGRWSVATNQKILELFILGNVSMPHAAGGRLQLHISN